jgi:hypothetical protein
MRWWNLLNNALFDGKLIPPKKIIVKKFRDDLGRCQPLSKKGHVILGICSEFYDRAQFISILAHEMIHQYQWTFVGEMTHGKSFWEWKEPLKTILDLPLHVSY